MCLRDTDIFGRISASMCTDKGRCLRNRNRVLREVFAPPDVETAGAGRDQIWLILLLARPLARHEEQIVLWVESVIGHLIPVPIPKCLNAIMLVNLSAFCRRGAL